MGKVSFLSRDVINRIAAGEVVERPASVVKELLENSVDAGAANIFMEIGAAGKKLISVRDDGSGIEPDDIEKLFQRHATSKIARAEDLYRIESLGFRGEALYSIGAVADVLLRSKSGAATGGGKEIHVRGGQNIGINDIGHPEGTTVEVRELFFNTPARRKFLRSDATEFRRILNMVIPYAMVFYGKRFSLFHNRKGVLSFNPSAGLLSRFCDVANVDKRNLIYAEKEIPEISLSLKVLLGDINLKMPTKEKQYVFINNRPVHNQSISYSIGRIYREIFPRDTYPVFAVFVKMPLEEIDVNIHPAKREVKLREEQRIASTLSDFCREVLLRRGKTTEVVRKTSIYFERNESQLKPDGGVFLKESRKPESLFTGTGSSETSTVPEQESIRAKLMNASYIGSYRNKYLLFESGDSLLAMDQHAAHERINYELLRRQFETGKIDIQRLLTPLIIKLDSEEIVVWEEGAEKLEDVGFLTTRWDAGSIAVHGFPQPIRNPEAAVRSLLSERGIDRADRKMLARKACKGSVAAGEKIKDEEAISIRNELLECEVPFVCPHGRPTVVEFSESFFDRQFLR